ncbi:MAG: low molecular weight protein arginine phosphatase [Candidatus Zixiibacteriota bacterium]|nr:MAG: low molecular weight protein arginine phosphatase [candidate division Zixibacteria bacterium]
MKGKYTVLFVCTGNTCRSPMAEGALRSILGKERSGKFEVISAGTAAASGFPATLYAIEAAKVWNVDISGHISQPLTGALLDKADLVLVMTPEHFREVIRLRRDAASKTFLLKNFPEEGLEGEPVADPIGQSLERYNATFLEIGEYLGKSRDEIVRRIDETINEK